MCHGLIHFSVFLHHSVLAKLAIIGIKVKRRCQKRILTQTLHDCVTYIECANAHAFMFQICDIFNCVKLCPIGKIP